MESVTQNRHNRSFNMVKTSAQPYKHIIHAYVYNHIQQTACHAGQQWRGTHTAMQDSDNNKVWHRVVGSQKQMAPSVANSPIRSGLNLASTHQMAPPSTHLIQAFLLIYRPGRMKGWVGLVGWPVADGLPFSYSTVTAMVSLVKLRGAFKKFVDWHS